MNDIPKCPKLTVTQESKGSRLFSFDNKKWRDFLVKIRKVQDQLKDAGVSVRFLTKEEATDYVDRYFAVNFRDKTISMSNFKVDEECIGMGNKKCKVYSLVDVRAAQGKRHRVHRHGVREPLSFQADNRKA